MKKLLSLLLLSAIACLGVCGSATAAATSSDDEEATPITFPKIDRRPAVEAWSRGALESLPRYDPKSENPWQVDLRRYDLSRLDLRGSLNDLLYATFDENTVWPADDKMPAAFDRERMVELGKNPGLGVRALHKRGITGRGVGIAIIDQPLLTEHEEYADRLRLYEEINVPSDANPAMHGAAVASIALGKTVGVAPEADLYYIGAWTFDRDVPEGKDPRNFNYYAQAIRRILEINKQLPEDRKIRVISISVGWNPKQKGYDEIMAANEEAIAAGLLVVSSSIEDTHKLDFFMLGRAPLSDPDDFNSCDRVLWRGYDQYRSDHRLLIPCDSRTTACHSGKDKYVFYRIGGASWSIPYIAGVYALAAQVDPTITPNRFWDIAMKTGRTVELERDGQKVRMRPIVDPGAIIAALQGESGAAAGAEAERAADEESGPITFPKIDRHPSPAVWSHMTGKMTSVPRYDPRSGNPFQVDLRCRDLSDLDLRGALNDLLYANFDDRTVWPPDDQMPRGFDRQRIMELGKNPALGVRKLHEQGITGRGIGIAIVDQVLLTKHKEYADRLRLYEEINVKPGTQAQMHGAAVASIALGKTVGVAPEADLYFIASWTVDWDKRGDDDWKNFAYYAQAVRRILEVNEQLPEGRKIRVISMSVGWHSSQRGYEEITAAVEEAKKAGMLVICSSVGDVHGFEFHGLDRAPLSDPDASESYGPGSWWAEGFYSGRRFSDRLLVPMDSRTTAAPNGADEYTFYRSGGWSWSIPYIAGVYALAAQVEPEITPDRFWSLAMKTGQTIELDHNGEKIPFGPIVDPAAIIAALRSESGAGAGDETEQAADKEPEPITFPKIDRHPAVKDSRREVLESLPHYNPESSSPFQVDLRGDDLSALDLRAALGDLLFATFDDDTTWPSPERMPRGFDPRRVMELGKNPGLGVRWLHKHGITGRGVGVAIIDQPLATKHQEYADRLWLYEEINMRPDSGAQMHGPAVASIAVGKTVGVAPEADLYFIAASTKDPDSDGITYTFYARAIRRILEINAQLPANRKIRVISISWGWPPGDVSSEDIMAAVEEANTAGILVICCEPDAVSGFDYYGMGRAHLGNPDVFESCRPSLPWVKTPYVEDDSLLIPMDARAVASPTGNSDYVFYRCGGKSWTTPYLAGMYALAVQVDPSITPARFWRLTMQTSRRVPVKHNGQMIRLGPIINPVALMRAVHNESRRHRRSSPPPSSISGPPNGITFPKIDRRPTPDPERFSRGTLTSLPRYQDDGEEIILERCDLSSLDLRDALNDLLYASFDERTVWPSADRMPRGFDPRRILEIGKNPGLGVRWLHKHGITGRGVGVAIIDQPLLTTHQEYADRLLLYEEINVKPYVGAQSHGTTVASIAVGKTVGVAPEADLYFIASWVVDFEIEDKEKRRNLAYYAQAIRRIVEINKQLPTNRKIRVISISAMWWPKNRGYDDIMAACAEAKAAGMFVICFRPEEVHGFDFCGLGRMPLSNPDAFESYGPSLARLVGFFDEDRRETGELLIPTDSHTKASFTGDDKYLFGRGGGMSSAIPYLAGVYALAAQVDPSITPERFRALVMETARPTKIKHNGKTYVLGPIIDPVAIIKALREK